MNDGKAIVSTITGTLDMGEVVTLSPGGPGAVVDVFKCPRCGHSIKK